MDIRMASRLDLADMLDIYNEEVAKSTATFDLNKKTMSDWEHWYDSHLRAGYPILTAVRDGKVIGYAGLSPYRDKEAYAQTVELSVYISQAARRNGAAKSLMREILKIAAERDDYHTVISVITSGNEASIRLHEEFGFTHCGTIREVGKKFGRLLDIDNYQLIV